MAELPEVDPATEPTFDFDPDPGLWLVGPDASRPPEVWLPLAADAMLAGVEPSPKRRDYVETMLRMIIERHPSPLPYVVLRWPGLETLPFPLYVGLSTLDGPDDAEELWLAGADEDVVEAPVITLLEDDPARRLRRSLVYGGGDGETGLIVGVRYVLSTAVPDVVFLAHGATNDPGEMMAILDDCDALVRTVTVRPPLGDPGSRHTGE